jgi:hypothetical protein
MIINSLIGNQIKEEIYNYLPMKDIATNLLNTDLTILKGGSHTETSKVLSDTVNMSEQLRDIINQELHKIKNDIPSDNEKNIMPVIPQNPQPMPQPLEQLNQPNQQGGTGQEPERKSPEHVINNDKIEINESKKEKLSSSENIKAIENEINKLEIKSDKSNTDLIKKLDNDRNELSHKGGKHHNSSTSSDYNASTENIAVYSNSNTSNKSGVFLQKNSIKKTIPKYENIKI